MNRNRSWNQNARGRGRGGFNRGGRGSNRGWSWNHGGYNGPPNHSFGGSNRFQRDNPPTHWKNKEKWVKRDSPGKRLSEDLIGVTEYISTHEGFNGIIKSRYAITYVKNTYSYYLMQYAFYFFKYNEIWTHQLVWLLNHIENMATV